MPNRSRRRPRSDTRSATAEAAATVHLAALLAGGADLALERFQQVAGETPGGAPALIAALGGVRSESAGQVLARIAADALDKELRKAARREIHRLRALGVAVELPAAAESVPVGARPAQALLTDAHATAPDGVGSRAVWLALERPFGGLAVFGMVLNDLDGVKDCTFRDTTRKRHRETLRDWAEEAETATFDVPPEYAGSLVSEGLALNAERGLAVPTELRIHRGLLGDLPPPPTDALIHRFVSRGQALLLPNLLEEASELLDEPELHGWFIGYDDLLPRAQELRRFRESRILLSGEPRDQREARTIDAAIDQIFTPPVRRAIRRRLEETAYAFWVTDRERSARRAVAAAFALGEGPLTRHPFVRALVTKSLELAIEAERGGIDPSTLRRGT